MAVCTQCSNWPRGKVLGGSSVLNYMLYVRGSPHDYDNWEREEGCTGWSWDSVLPYFIKSENNGDPDVASNGAQGLQSSIIQELEQILLRMLFLMSKEI